VKAKLSKREQVTMGRLMKDINLSGTSHNKIVYHNCAHTLQDLRSLEEKGVLTLKLKKKDEKNRNTKYKCVHVELTLVGEVFCRCVLSEGYKNV
jgi:hypothetical protein